MPSSQNPAHMTPEQIVAEINGLREGIQRGATRLQELAQDLYSRSRRTSPNHLVAAGQDPRSIYITYSNALKRFSGVVLQGLQRTHSAERILGLLPKNGEMPPQEPVPPPRRRGVVTAGSAHSMPVETSPLRDFIEIYGEEIVSDADGPQR